MEQTAPSDPPLEATMIDGTLAQRHALCRSTTMKQSKDIVRRFIDEALNEGNVDVAAQFVWGRRSSNRLPFPACDAENIDLVNPESLAFAF